jgi:hypothetical protein
MRSDLVYSAVKNTRNRYMLCQVASKATRKFHRPNTRIQETTNEVLNRVARADRPLGVSQRQTVVAEPQRRAA